MGFRDQYYPQTVAVLITRNGESAPDPSGNRMPITSAVDTLGVLGTLAPQVIRILENFQNRTGSIDDVRGAANERYVDQDGFFTPDAAELSTALSDVLPWKDYVAGYPRDDNAAARTTLSHAGTYYVPWLPPRAFSAFSETDLQVFLRSMMTDWQHCVDASAAGIRASANTSQPMPAVNIQIFWAAVRRLCTTMDVIDTNPPLDFFERVKGAVSTALDQSAEFAGKAAAGLAEKTGEIVGNFGKGFFDQAGILSLAVAGIAVFLFVK